MRKTLASAIFLAVMMLDSPQQLLSSSKLETTSPVVQIGQDGSPLEISGNVTAGDEGSGVLRYSISRKLTVNNVSSKSIMLAVLEVNIRNISKIDVHSTREDDDFFRPDSFAPNTTKTLEESTGPFGEPTSGAVLEPAAPEATVRVVFVQFADGSTWGNPDAGRRALRERYLSWDEMKLLSEAYQKDGKERFGAELLKPTDLQAIRKLQRLYADGPKDMAVVLNEMSTMLRYADLHQRGMEK
jgi:hypothetical protein